MNDIPDIEIEYDDNYNPIVTSPNAPYGIPFYQTRESMMDVEVYKSFLDNAIANFRHITPFYKNYKSYLMSLGLDHCQVMSNVNEENVGAKGIEMNHNFLTLFDIALMITEHILNTVGYISTFDLIYLLKYEHSKNRIPIVMLSETVHQMHHANADFILPAQMCFGYWVELLQRYNRGITPKLCQKIINYIDVSINMGDINADTIQELMGIKENIEGWSRFNEYADNRRIGTVSVVDGNYLGYNNMPYITQNPEG